jgi:hypothetical protein
MKLLQTHTEEITVSDSNKSGYAIRADLLGMAIGILESKNNRLENNEHFSAENDKKYQRQPVTPYTTNDVISEAEKLYQFVQKK